MQLKYLAAGALLPLSVFASPTPDLETHPDATPSTLHKPDVADVVEEGGWSPNVRRDLVRPQLCRILDTVNCRDGPGTKWPVLRQLRGGTSYNFWCVQSGECITLDGFQNCGWHYSRDLDCFVNGHYTSNECRLASLGRCGGNDDTELPDGPP